MDPGPVMAMQAWQMMGNRLDWQALPTVSAILGIEDVEALVANLVTIRDGLKDAHG